MYNVPVRVHASLMAAANADVMGRIPPSPMIGSAMIAAVVSVTAAVSASGFNGSTNVTGPMRGPNGAR